MARAVRWFLSSLATIFLAALFQPWAEIWLRDYGWYDDPTVPMGAAMNWIAGIIGADAFPWMAGITFGLAGGVWLDWVLRRFDKSRPSQTDEFRELYPRFLKLISRIENEIPDLPVLRPRMKLSAQLSSDIHSFHLTLRRLGLKVPDNIWIDDHFKIADAELHYLTHLSSLSRDGHFDEAKVMAGKICEDISLFISGKHPKQSEIERNMLA